MLKKKVYLTIIGKKVNMYQDSALTANKTQASWKNSARLKIR